MEKGKETFRLENGYQIGLYQDFVNFLALNSFKLTLKLIDNEELKKTIVDSLFNSWLSAQVTVHNNIIKKDLEEQKGIISFDPEIKQELLNKDLQEVKKLVRSLLDIY